MLNLQVWPELAGITSAKTSCNQSSGNVMMRDHRTEVFFFKSSIDRAVKEKILLSAVVKRSVSVCKSFAKKLPG